LSSAGKSTIASLVYAELRNLNYAVEWLDGDAMRQSLCKGLGFSKSDRDENVRRIGLLAELLNRNGIIVLVSAISPYRAGRNEVRQLIEGFIEVYVQAPMSVCEHRDTKGIYRKARSGQLTGVTGIDDPYEPPEVPELVCATDCETPAESAAKVLRLVQQWIEADRSGKGATST
jgi:adenylylsulfate kinase